MIRISPSAVELLADLAEHGIDVEPVGDAIRFRPRHAMTPALLERLQTHKAELMAVAMVQQATDRDDDDLAERLAEAWGKRIAICIEDGKESQQAAATIALKQLRRMVEK